MIDVNVVNAFMVGAGIGLTYMPIWYIVVYVIDSLWVAFRPEVKYR